MNVIDQVKDHSEKLSSSALAALRSGSKIEAIKAVRLETGVDFKEAKHIVERYVTNESSPRFSAALSSGPESISSAVTFALQSGDKIGAIKIVRAEHGVGLKDAKDIVEHYIADDPGLQAALAKANEEALKESLPRLIAIIALVAWVLYYLATK